jgi:hypothetical protein
MSHTLWQVQLFPGPQASVLWVLTTLKCVSAV